MHFLVVLWGSSYEMKIPAVAPSLFEFVTPALRAWMEHVWNVHTYEHYKVPRLWDIKGLLTDWLTEIKLLINNHKNPACWVLTKKSHVGFLCSKEMIYHLTAFLSGRNGFWTTWWTWNLQCLAFTAQVHSLGRHQNTQGGSMVVHFVYTVQCHCRSVWDTSSVFELKFALWRRMLLGLQWQWY